MKDTPLSAPAYAPPARGGLERLAVKVTDWSERWFPDSYIFAAIAVVVVAIGAMLIFEVSRRCEHRVHPLTGGGPRRVFTGWFIG